MLRCAASFVIAAYTKVRRIPHDLRALPAELFTQPLNGRSWDIYVPIRLDADDGTNRFFKFAGKPF
jgi:hypothetical protein